MHCRVLAELPLFGKKPVTDLLSVRTIIGFVASHRMCANPWNVMYNVENSFEYMDMLSCAGEKVFEPNATGAYVFRFDCIFWSGLSSIMRAYPALLKLASVFKTSCVPGMGCFNASWQASLRALLTESIVSFNSDVIFNGTSVLSNL